MQNFCITISIILANFHMKYNYILSTQKFCTLIHLSKGVQNFCNPISTILDNFHTKYTYPKHSEILHLNPLEERDAEYFYARWLFSWLSTAVKVCNSLVRSCVPVLTRTARRPLSTAATNAFPMKGKPWKQ